MEFVLMELRSNQDTHQRKSILKKARNKTWWTQITVSDNKYSEARNY